ncbi:hypothetical protein CHH28_06335 [Bacterioplanes sanyensis]|uniref:Uncharacterized protein n=1 Tax=Bacterioplanes sanyensis TaxID=1249553 RepID=A0A222FHS7_9GAMM|nr:hypothetical protein [Bacterioplanes sanyensis]ASP38320.1 hypothetical protein CHH28_06335 [Bacterioplanes sanyensis]
MAAQSPTANILTFPLAAPTQRADRKPQAQASDSPQQRFEQLEQRIRQFRGDTVHQQWLDAYLDQGLELACRAGQRELWALQESWLHRMYRALRDTGLDLKASTPWRAACLEALYQPFFALRHLPRGQHDPRCGQRLHVILRDFAVISRHLV